MSGRTHPGFSGPLVSLLCLVFPLASIALAQQIPSEPDARDRGQIAEKFVKERLVVWQERLSLQEWKITILMAHPSDLKPKTLGNIHWDATKHTAVIRVLDASDYKMGFQDMLDDMEFTVVHELIHLELSSLPRSEASRSDEEHAVNRIADALLKLDRKR
jgi:hypothetical protein